MIMAIFFKILSATVLLLLLPHFIISISVEYSDSLALNANSPQSLAYVLPFGVFFTGVSNGRILQYPSVGNRFLNFGYTSPTRTSFLCDNNVDNGSICGLPLGISLDYRTIPTILGAIPIDLKLYVCDPYRGLTVVGPFGGLATTLVPTTNGVPYKYLYAVDYAANKRVYFTNASTKFGPKDVALNGFNQTDDATGELLEYDPATKQIRKLLTGLAGPVGVATDINATFVLVAELNSRKITKYFLTGENANTSKLLIRFATGNLQEIKRTVEGDFWVALNLLRDDFTNSPQGFKFNSDGQRLATVFFSAGNVNIKQVTSIQEFQGTLYTAGKDQSSVFRYKIVPDEE